MNEYLDVSFIKINILPCQNMKILTCLNLSKALSMTTWARYFINLLNLHRYLETLSTLTKVKNRTLIKLKSDNLQHNTLGCWDKQLINQVSNVPSTYYLFFIIYIHNFLWAFAVTWTTTKEGYSPHSIKNIKK